MWEVYRALWASLEAEGVRVSYSVFCAGGVFRPPDGPPRGTLPRGWIEIRRVFTPDPPDKPSMVRGETWVPGHPRAPAHPNLTTDVVILAHEAGHHASWKAGNWTPAYVSADKASKPPPPRKRRDGDEEPRAWERGERQPRFEGQRHVPKPRVTRDQKRLIMAEEQRAWELARSILARLGFDEWDAFEAQRSVGLGSYRRMPLRRHTR